MIKTTVMTVTPQMAEEWLGKSKINRNVRQSHVDRLARDIADGKWLLTGEAIKLNGDGALMDGQHRCHAVIKAQSPIETVVISGVQSHAQAVMDTGSKRTLSDVLKLFGEDHTTTLAAAIVAYWQIVNKNVQGRTAPSYQECIALLEQNPDLRKSMAWGQRVRSALRVSAGLMTAFHYVATSIDEDDAEFFFEHLVSGASLAATHPVLQLRDRLAQDAMAARKMPRQMVAALVIKSWNAFREGREVKLLRWRAGGANPEAFPEMA